MPTTQQSESFTSTLQSATESWQSFSFDTKRSSLQQFTTHSKSNHQQAQKSRKALADLTKAFKKTVKQTESILVKSTSSTTTTTTTTTTTGENNAKFSNQCKSTVKAYQEEIDNLSKRCKGSETIITELFKSFQDVSDPTPILMNAAQHLSSMEGQVQHLLNGMEEMQSEMEKQGLTSRKQITKLDKELQTSQSQIDVLRQELKDAQQNEQQQQQQQQQKSSNSLLGKEEKEELISLRREVAEYELEFKTLKNQDITIKKLNAKIEDLVVNQEDELQRELKKTQEHLAQTEGRRVTEALEREATMARKLASLELELKAERAGSQVAQTHLLEADQGQNEREAVWEAQRQILVDDSDRLRETLHEATRERDSLKMRVEALSGSGDDDDDDGDAGAVSGRGNASSMVDIVAERKAYEAEVGELTLTVTAMRDEVRSKDETMLKLQSSMQATVESLESERGFLANKVAELEQEIAKAPGKDIIEKMCRELRILKKLEYNAVDNDTEREEPELTSSPIDDGDEDLESVLIGKLKRVEADLVKERREKNAHFDECKNLKDELMSVEMAKVDAETLVARLESDLEKAITAPPSTSSNQTPGSDMPIPTESDPSTLQHILDPNSPAPAAPTSLKSQEEKVNDDHSVATIVMAQRDRLRGRCEGLEGERDGFKRELQMQVATAESLKADNTKLYEKVRYLQNYNNSNASMRARAVDRDLDLEALEQRYEASVDPFKQFSRNEKQRKMNEMSPMEKTVFVVARTVLGSKEMRTALFFYVSILHLLVFATTYHWSHGCHAVPHHSALDDLHAGIPNMEESTP